MGIMDDVLLLILCNLLLSDITFAKLADKLVNAPALLLHTLQLAVTAQTAHLVPVTVDGGRAKDVASIVAQVHSQPVDLAFAAVRAAKDVANGGGLRDHPLRCARKGSIAYPFRTRCITSFLKSTAASRLSKDL